MHVLFGLQFVFTTRETEALINPLYVHSNLFLFEHLTTRYKATDMLSDYISS